MFYLDSPAANGRVYYPTKEGAEHALEVLATHHPEWWDAEVREDIAELPPKPTHARFRATIKFEFSAPLVDNDPAHTAFMIQENYANGETILDKVQSVLDDAGAEYGDDAFKVKVKK